MNAFVCHHGVAKHKATPAVNIISRERYDRLVFLYAFVITRNNYGTSALLTVVYLVTSSLIKSEAEVNHVLTKPRRSSYVNHVVLMLTSFRST